MHCRQQVWRTPSVLLAFLWLAGAGYVASVYLRTQPGHSLWWDDWFYDAVLWAAGLMCGWGARRGPQRGTGTSLLALALLLYAGGNTVWSIWVAPQANPPYPSVADYLWLSFYPLGLAAIWLLAGPGARPGLFQGLDTLLGALAVAAVGMLVSIEPIAHNVTGTPAAVIVNLAYPVGDLSLLVMLLSTALASRRRPPVSSLLLAVSMLAWAVADSTYVFQVAAGTYEQGTILDVGWLVPITFLACVPWIGRTNNTRAPAVKPGPDQTQHRGEADTVGRSGAMLMPMLLAGGCLSLLVKQAWDEAPWFAALAGAALTAAGARMVLSARELARLAHARTEARTDELTGLGNRRAFLEVLGARFGTGEPFHLLLLDLDGFKNVNDTLGHGAGDICLQAIAKRLTGISPERRALFRLGGDEFAVLAPADPDTVQRLVARLRTEIARPVPIGDNTANVATSIGIISCPDQAASPAQALRGADVAMYHAKTYRLGHAHFGSSPRPGQDQPDAGPVPAARHDAGEVNGPVAAGYRGSPE